MSMSLGGLGVFDPAGDPAAALVSDEVLLAAGG